MTHPHRNFRKDERGAALVMALFVIMILSIGVAGLLLESSRNSQNVTDATAEQEAYSAAESGIQSAVNVLRYKCTQAVSPCKIAPSPLYAPALPDYHNANRINYSRALTMATSNVPGDTSTAARLSRWISYDPLANDRVKLGDPDIPYSTMNGYAYSLAISDPDNTGSAISFYTTGNLYDHDPGNRRKRTYTSGSNTTTIEYRPAGATNLNITGGTLVNTRFGSFTFSYTGVGVKIPSINRFEIVVNVTHPVPAQRMIRGFILMNEPLAAYTVPPKIVFDSQTYDIRGSDISLNMGGTMRLPDNPPGSEAPFGYVLSLASNGVATDVAGTMSPPQPARLLIRSTGYGPRGARKELEAIIQNNYFNALGAPGTITMVGPPSTASPATTFIFDPGNSNAMLYSGQDNAAGSTDIIPPIATTFPADPDTGDDPNLEAVQDAIGGKLSDNVIGVPSNAAEELPYWLSSPAAMDAAIQQLYNIARNSADPTNPTGRYFPSGVNPTNWGDNATATGITFCDGNCVMGPASGGGILVVTGRLELHGNFSFNGLIIVTGQDGVLRSGGGNGLIQGNLVIAPYVGSAIAGGINPAAGQGFLSPQYRTSGGGNSTIMFNSNNQLNGLGAVSNIVLGVAEK